jgi:CarD family transcriptional regulator
MPSPNKSNKIASKSSAVSKKDSGAGSKAGKTVSKKEVGKAPMSVAAAKSKSAAKNAADSVKSSKPASTGANAKAGQSKTSQAKVTPSKVESTKTNNSPAKSGSKASVKGTEGQNVRVKAADAAMAGKSATSTAPAVKAAAAKPVGSKTPAPVATQSASARPAAAVTATAPKKVAVKQVEKATSAGDTGSKSNQSGTSKKPIVTNTKATSEPKAASIAKAKENAKPVTVASVQAEAPVAVKPSLEKLKVASDAKVNAEAPKAAPVAPAKPAPAAQAPVRPAAPAVGANGVRINPPYRPAVAPAMAKPVTKPGVPHAGFKAGEHIVYPAHGVGQIIAIEEQEVAGFKLELFVIGFVKDKMTLKVPMPKVLAGAIRKLSSADAVKKALDTLTGRARIKRTMWSRRAQEYEAKINSGDLVTIAEVVRDLYRSDAQPEQSYSERQLYEAAVDRMAREVAAVQKLTEQESLKLIEQHLQRGPRRGAKTEADSADDGADAAIDEAA